MLKKYIIIFGILGLLLISLSLLAKDNPKDKTVSDGNTNDVIGIDEFEQLSNINSIYLDGNYTVIIEQSDSPSLQIKGTGKKHLNVFVEDNTLYIKNKYKSGIDFKNKTDIEVNIQLPQLKAIFINGLIDLHNTLPINGNKLDIDFNGVGEINLTKLNYESIKTSVNGTGSVEMNGNTNTLFLELKGLGSIDTQNLKAYRCIAKNNGVGSISLYAENELDAFIDGIGTIEYLGNPKVRKHIDGLGTIDRIDWFFHN